MRKTFQLQEEKDIDTDQMTVLDNYVIFLCIFY